MGGVCFGRRRPHHPRIDLLETRLGQSHSDDVPLELVTHPRFGGGFRRFFSATGMHVDMGEVEKGVGLHDGCVGRLQERDRLLG